MFTLFSSDESVATAAAEAVKNLAKSTRGLVRVVHNLIQCIPKHHFFFFLACICYDEKMTIQSCSSIYKVIVHLVYCSGAHFPC